MEWILFKYERVGAAAGVLSCVQIARNETFIFLVKLKPALHHLQGNKQYRREANLKRMFFVVEKFEEEKIQVLLTWMWMRVNRSKVCWVKINTYGWTFFFVVYFVDSFWWEKKKKHLLGWWSGWKVLKVTKVITICSIKAPNFKTQRLEIGEDSQTRYIPPHQFR